MKKPRAAVGSRRRKQTSSGEEREKRALSSSQARPPIPDGEELALVKNSWAGFTGYERGRFKPEGTN